MTATLTRDDARQMLLDHPDLLAELTREALKDKSYEETRLGPDVAAYMRAKRMSMAENSLLAYESTLSHFCLHFRDLQLRDFEPPVGAERIEEFLYHWWGTCDPNTYNAHVKRLRSFFKWQLLRQRINANPMELVELAKRRQKFRESFSLDQVRAIITAQDELRDRIAVRLMLHYGIRRGGMLAVQYKHFDHLRRELTVFLKGGRIEALPINELAFWHDLERHMIEAEARPNHFLMRARYRDPAQPMSPHGFHKWWYRCLTKAGIVSAGETSGERPHKARHTTGQLILDQTGDLKLVQQTLKHTSIRTTADIYVNYEIAQLAAKLGQIWGDED